MSARNAIAIVVGAILVVMGFLGVIAVNSLLRPQIDFYLVATDNIDRGEVISESKLGVISVARDSVPEQFDAEAIPASLAPQVVGQIASRPILKGSILVFSAVASGDGKTFYANALRDPNSVVVLLDASPGIPPKLNVGDAVNIIVVAGSTFGGETLPEPTPQPTPTPPFFSAPLATPTPVPTQIEPPTEAVDLIMPTETPAPTLQPVYYPIAHTILENIPVIDVIRAGEEANARITQIAVAVPRQYQNFLVMANNARAIRITIASPASAAFTQTIPSLPASYGDIATLYRFSQMESAQRGESITSTFYARYLQVYYPSIYNEIRATQEAWFARERGVTDEKMDRLIRPSLP